LTAFRGGVVFELKERMLLEVTNNSRESHNTLRRV
jgi:hypothetical protein